MYDDITMYDGSHSIKLNDEIDTWKDWHLLPTSRPLFNPPKPKFKYVDVPGSSGALDVTNALTPYPTFEDREGSWEFIVVNGYGDWTQRYHDILTYLQGIRMKAILKDEPDYFYIGRFSVNDWKSNNDGTWSTITIDYRVEPYKWSLLSSVDPWLWDPFNFRTGIILEKTFKDIVVGNGEFLKYTYTNRLYGNAPITPSFIVDTVNGVDIRFVNQTLGIDKTHHVTSSGEVKFGEFILYGPSVDVYLKGTDNRSKVSIKFHIGYL